MTPPRRRRSEIVAHLEDFPRQYAALDSAMSAFGENFDLDVFKEAFDTKTDLEAYNRVQAVERALGRVQNFVADLAIGGMLLADLPRDAKGSEAERAFHALRAAKVIDGALCRKLLRAQAARMRIEHGYVKTRAGDVHRTAQLVQESGGKFIRSYRGWIESYLR